ncbi:MAG: hypothetical protein J6S13_05195 [Clostridia bacterium]|nr:hypothetical protein [Clostridia bacterium]
MDNNTIKILKGPDRVRKRPAVIFGSNGKKGAVQAVRMVLSIFINEAVKGHCSQIGLQVLNETTVKVISHDRGFLISDTEVDGHPEWYYKFCEMYPAPCKPKDNGFAYELGINGDSLYSKCDVSPKFRFSTSTDFDICCVQYASSNMIIRSFKDGQNKALLFEKGVFLKQEEKPCEGQNRTEITFKPDEEVFGKFTLSVDDFREYLRAAAVTVRGLKFRLYDKETDHTEEFCYEGGAVDYIKESVAEPVLIFQDELEARGRERYNRPEYSARLKITVGFKKDTSEMLCFHNFKLKNRISSYAYKVKYDMMDSVKKVLDIDSDSFINDFENSIVLLVESNCEPYHTVYCDLSNQKVDNRLLNEMSEDIVGRRFYDFVKQNREKLAEIFVG